MFLVRPWCPSSPHHSLQHTPTNKGMFHCSVPSSLPVHLHLFLALYHGVTERWAARCNPMQYYRPIDHLPCDVSTQGVPGVGHSPYLNPHLVPGQESRTFQNLGALGHSYIEGPLGSPHPAGHLEVSVRYVPPVMPASAAPSHISTRIARLMPIVTAVPHQHATAIPTTSRPVPPAVPLSEKQKQGGLGDKTNPAVPKTLPELNGSKLRAAPRTRSYDHSCKDKPSASTFMFCADAPEFVPSNMGDPPQMSSDILMRKVSLPAPQDGGRKLEADRELQSKNSTHPNNVEHRSTVGDPKELTHKCTRQILSTTGIKPETSSIRIGTQRALVTQKITSVNVEGSPPFLNSPNDSNIRETFGLNLMKPSSSGTESCSSFEQKGKEFIKNDSIGHQSSINSVLKFKNQTILASKDSRSSTKDPNQFPPKIDIKRLGNDTPKSIAENETKELKYLKEDNEPIEKDYPKFFNQKFNTKTQQKTSKTTLEYSQNKKIANTKHDLKVNASDLLKSKNKFEALSTEYLKKNGKKEQRISELVLIEKSYENEKEKKIDQQYFPSDLNFNKKAPGFSKFISDSTHEESLFKEKSKEKNINDTVEKRVTNNIRPVRDSINLTKNSEKKHLEGVQVENEEKKSGEKFEKMILKSQNKSKNQRKNENLKTGIPNSNQKKVEYSHEKNSSPNDPIPADPIQKSAIKDKTSDLVSNFKSKSEFKVLQNGVNQNYFDQCSMKKRLEKFQSSLHKKFVQWANVKFDLKDKENLQLISNEIEAAFNPQLIDQIFFNLKIIIPKANNIEDMEKIFNSKEEIFNLSHEVNRKTEIASISPLKHMINIHLKLDQKTKDISINSMEIWMYNYLEYLWQNHKSNILKLNDWILSILGSDEGLRRILKYCDQIMSHKIAKSWKNLKESSIRMNLITKKDADEIESLCELSGPYPNLIRNQKNQDFEVILERKFGITEYSNKAIIVSLFGPTTYKKRSIPNKMKLQYSERIPSKKYFKGFTLEELYQGAKNQAISVNHVILISKILEMDKENQDRTNFSSLTDAKNLVSLMRESSNNFFKWKFCPNRDFLASKFSEKKLNSSIIRCAKNILNQSNGIELQELKTIYADIVEFENTQSPFFLS